MSSFTLLLIFTLTIIHQTLAEDVITCTFDGTKNHNFSGTLTLSKNGDGNLAIIGKVLNNGNKWHPNQAHAIAVFENATNDDQDCSIIGNHLNPGSASIHGAITNGTLAFRHAGDWSNSITTNDTADLVVNIVDHFIFNYQGISDASDLCNRTIAIYNGTDDLNPNADPTDTQGNSGIVVACCTVAKAVPTAAPVPTPTAAAVAWNGSLVWQTYNPYGHVQNQYGYPWGWNPPYDCTPPDWWSNTAYTYTAAPTPAPTPPTTYYYTSTAAPTPAPTPPPQYNGYPAPYYPPYTTTTTKATTTTTVYYTNCYYTCNAYPYEVCQEVVPPACVPSYYVKCSAPNQAVLAVLAVLVGLLALLL